MTASKLSFSFVGDASPMSGKLYPNGEYGYAKTSTSATTFKARRRFSEDTRWNVCRLHMHGLRAALQYLQEQNSTPSLLRLLQGGLEGYSEGGSAPAPLDSSKVSNSHNPSQRGSGGLTRYGGKMVRNAVYLLERNYGKDRLSFLTLTLPNLSADGWAIVVDEWSDVVRQFMQWLQRKQQKAGLAKLAVAVTELQPERTLRDGVPALHLHIVFLGRKERKGWVVSPSQIRSAWRRILVGKLGRESEGLYWDAVENLQRVRKSAQGYLAKYLSKGAQGYALAVEKGVAMVSAWWNCTALLRKMVKAEVRQLSARDVWLLDIMKAEGGESYFRWERAIMVPVPAPIGSDKPDAEIPVGVAGRLTSQGMSRFLELRKQS